MMGPIMVKQSFKSNSGMPLTSLTDWQKQHKKLHSMIMCLMHGTLCCLGPNTNLRQNSEHTPQLPLTHLLPPAATCERANTGTNTGTNTSTNTNTGKNTNTNTNTNKNKYKYKNKQKHKYKYKKTYTNLGFRAPLSHICSKGTKHERSTIKTLQ